MPLSYSKCQRCRTDRQKCLPVDRTGTAKCLRCEKMNLLCSEPIKGNPGRPKGVKRLREPQLDVVLVDRAHNQVPGDTLDLLQLDTIRANVPQPHIPVALSFQFPRRDPARISDLLFLLSWYPMLKQAMTELESLNNEILNNFDIEQDQCSLAFKRFKSFTEELVPCVLRELQYADEQILSPSLLRLLGDCVHKPANEIVTRCLVCSKTPETERSINVHIQDTDLVNEFQSGVSRLWGHLECECSCNHEQYSQSALYSIEVTSERMTAKINNVFTGDGITGLELPSTIRNSAVFFPGYGRQLGFPNLATVDCLGRNCLHRYFDSKSRYDTSFIEHSETFLGEHAHLGLYADILGRSPLHIAMSKNYFLTEPLGDLLCAPTINMETAYGHTPLHYLAFKTDPRPAFLPKPKNLPKSEVHSHLHTNILDVEQRSALSRVIENGSLHRINFFLENFCIDINLPDESDGYTPLTQTIGFNRMDVLHHLLQLPGIDANARDREGPEDIGGTPLHYAIAWGSFQSLQLLGTWNGIDWNKPFFRGGGTALHYAAGVSEDSRFLKYVLEHQEVIDINVRDDSGSTPLHWAAKGEGAENISLLLNMNGVDVNARDNEGRTPLICLVQKLSRGRAVDLIPAVKAFMVDSRVDLGVEDNHGDTAFTIAQKRSQFKLGAEEIFPYLLREPSLYVSEI